MNKRNYQKELDKLIERNQKEGKTPRLFLHACCAPCSSYVMEYLSQYFEITIFFYNPNIAPVEEYSHRVAEIRRLIGEMEFVHPVTLMEGRYDPKEFYEMAKGLEDVPEGGERCFRCYRLRILRKRMATSVLLNCLMSMLCTGRIIAAVYFQRKKPWTENGWLLRIE